MLESLNWLYMYMPLSDVSVFWPGLILIGFLSGVFGGGYGIRGTWMVTPGLNVLGFPMVFAVGTSITQTAGMSMIFAVQHFRCDIVDYKLFWVMSLSTITGLELGAQVIMHLERVGLAGSVVRWAYMIFLTIILLFVICDQLREKAGKRNTDNAGEQNDDLSRGESLSRRDRPPDGDSNVSSISSPVWWPALISLATGVVAGMLGMGSSVLRLPALVHLVGCQPYVTVGTDIFESMFSGMYGAFSYAYKGRVEIIAALVMLFCATAGERVQGVVTKHVSSAGRRQLFVATALCCLASIILKQARFHSFSMALLLGGMSLICLVILKFIFQGMAMESKAKDLSNDSDSCER